MHDSWVRLKAAPFAPAAIGIYAALLIAVYFSTLSWLILHDWAVADFAYAYMIPAVIAYLLWERRGALASVPSVPSWSGMVLLVPGIAFFWLGELSGEYFSQYISLWLTAAGICWLHLGWRKLKTTAPAFFIALTMFPPPNTVYVKISLKLKLVSSRLGVRMMQLAGLSVHREGNVIDLGFTQLQVVDACSGLRYLIPLVVLGILLAYFIKGSLWKKLFLLLSTIPLSILSNSLRIAITGILSQYYGPVVAEGFFHDFAGWFIFMSSLGMLVLLMGVSGRIEAKLSKRAKNEGDRGMGRETTAAVEDSSGRTEGGRSDRSGPVEKNRPIIGAAPRFIIPALMLAATLILLRTVDFREKIVISKPLGEFPMQIGPWEGRRVEMEQRIIDTLDLSDYVMADYAGDDGKTVNFYVAFYQIQSKGKSIHSPETCLPGGGWRFVRSGRFEVPLADGTTMPVSRVVMEKNGDRQLGYFWFPQRGRILTNLYELKLYTFWDALTKHRTDGALVRAITPVYPGEGIGLCEDRLQTFVRLTVPILNLHLPQ